VSRKDTILLAGLKNDTLHRSILPYPPSGEYHAGTTTEQRHFFSVETSLKAACFEEKIHR
jgi:hypothetical protein